MFAVQLLDALAEAVVLLVFDMTPTCPSSDDDENVSRGSAGIAPVNGISLQDSGSLSGYVMTTHSRANSNNGTWSPLQAPSIDNGSFIQLTTEDLQTIQNDSVGAAHGVSEQTSSFTSTSSCWTVAGRLLIPSHMPNCDDATGAGGGV